MATEWAWAVGRAGGSPARATGAVETQEGRLMEYGVESNRYEDRTV